MSRLGIGSGTKACLAVLGLLVIFYVLVVQSPQDLSLWWMLTAPLLTAFFVFAADWNAEDFTNKHGIEYPPLAQRLQTISGIIGFGLVCVGILAAIVLNVVGGMDPFAIGNPWNNTTAVGIPSVGMLIVTLGNLILEISPAASRRIRNIRSRGLLTTISQLRLPGSSTVLQYVTTDGERRETEVKLGAKEVSLEDIEISKIDLTPLSACHKLKDLSLVNNRLQTIDLSPLFSCKDLKLLNLGGNRLQSIDLSPLSSCTKLKYLILSYNQLKAVDLSPLSSCAFLSQLMLEDNQLEAIDLSPLSSCQNLEILFLNNNSMKEIDLSPLFSCRFLASLENWPQDDFPSLESSTKLKADIELLKEGRKIPPAIRAYRSEIEWISHSAQQRRTPQKSRKQSDGQDLQIPRNKRLRVWWDWQNVRMTNSRKIQSLIEKLRTCGYVIGYVCLNTEKDVSRKHYSKMRKTMNRMKIQIVDVPSTAENAADYIISDMIKETHFRRDTTEVVISGDHHFVKFVNMAQNFGAQTWAIVHSWESASQDLCDCVNWLSLVSEVPRARPVNPLPEPRGSGSQGGAPPVREILKEIVLVKCPNCGRNNPQHLAECENCGAPL